MRRLYYIAAIAVTLLAAMPMQAQEETTPPAQQAARKGPRASRGERTDKKNTGLPDLTVRAQEMNERLTQEIGNARWQRVIYRELDLTKDVNAVLYYPEEPTDGLTNMFSILFDAFVKGNLKAYEYIDGRELLDEAHQVKVQDVLETHGIDPSDVPCYQVLSYYIKEQWDFDRNTSQYDSHIVAICPILHRQGEFGGITRYPLFWLRYDELRPFIIDRLVMSSGINTAVRYSIDDFFTLAKYEGEIYKVQNPRGLTLMQQYPDEAQLKAKREEIENELKNFGKTIWVPQEQKAETQTAADTTTAFATETEPSAEANKQQTGNNDKRRSVRRNRRTKEVLQ